MDITLQDRGRRVWAKQTNRDNVGQTSEGNDPGTSDEAYDDYQKNLQRNSLKTELSPIKFNSQLTSTNETTNLGLAARKNLIAKHSGHGEHKIIFPAPETGPLVTMIPTLSKPDVDVRGNLTHNVRLPIIGDCIAPISSHTITTMKSYTENHTNESNRNSTNEFSIKKQPNHNKDKISAASHIEHRRAADPKNIDSFERSHSLTHRGPSKKLKANELFNESGDLIQTTRESSSETPYVPRNLPQNISEIANSGSAAQDTNRVSHGLNAAAATSRSNAPEITSAASASTSCRLAQSAASNLHAVKPNILEKEQGLSTIPTISMSSYPISTGSTLGSPNHVSKKLKSPTSCQYTLGNNNNHESRPDTKLSNSCGGVRMKSRPKKKGLIMSVAPSQQSSNIKADEEKVGSTDDAVQPDKIKSTDDLQQANGPNTSIFSWDLYLKLVPAIAAPREAFNQPTEYPKNNFLINMKLEVCDPRNVSVWGLASVVGIEGLYLRLRFENTDKSNDVIELIDSEKIRPVGSAEEVLAPVGYQGNIASYSKFVEKILSDPTTVIASADLFPAKPKPPKRNLFQVGMKLEAVDMKHRDLVCPATIGQVDGDTVRVKFDGWKGSFDYDCNFRSRDLFPINWCRDTGHYMQPPNGWEGLVRSGGVKSIPCASKSLPSKATKFSPKTNKSHRHQQYQKSINQALNKSNSKHDHPSKNDTNLGHFQGTNKPRGRPPKDPAKIAARLTAQQDSNEFPRYVSKETSILRKDSSEVIIPELDSQDNPRADDASSSPTLDQVMSPTMPCVQEDRFQCQRIVPYDLWRQKQNEDQMPHGTKNQLENSTTDEASISSSDHFASFSAANVETTSSTNNSDDTPKIKKLKSDNIDGIETNDRITRVLSSKPNNVSSWSIQDVIDLISTDEALAKYSTVFMENEIDGKAFILLTKEILLKHMAFKIGPYLKIADLIDKVKNLK